MDFGKIDDPVDASFGAWPEEQDDMGKKLGEIALGLTGLVFVPAKALKIFKDHFSRGGRGGRAIYLIEALNIGLKWLEKNTETRLKDVEGRASAQEEALKAIQTKINTPQFEEAVAVACEEAARASDRARVDQFAQILVGSLSPNPWQEPDEDVATIIRNIAQLGTGDLKALEILRKVHSTAIAQNPNLYSSDAFSKETATLKRAIADSKIHPDDFLSRCERLRGFGLAAEPTRNNNQMAPDDYCYRPTRRGLALLTYLMPYEHKSAAP
jgi:hypothetical protein